jgi:hypothetical protein
MTADFAVETLKARRAWNEVFQTPHENNFILVHSTHQNYHSKLKEQ